MCDQGPAALVNGRPITNLSMERIDLIADLILERSPVSKWPTALFEVNDNIRKAGMLLGEPFESGNAIKAALARGADATLAELKLSRLRGRGGAGMPPPTSGRVPECPGGRALPHLQCG